MALLFLSSKDETSFFRYFLRDIFKETWSISDQSANAGSAA